METAHLIKSENTCTKPANSLWKSSEFLAYYAVIATAIYFTVKECIIISLPSHPVHENYAHLLSQGWLFNLKIVIKNGNNFCLSTL